MMGRQTGDQSQLFYLFNLEDRIPAGHLLRRINPVVTQVLAGLRERLEPFYSELGRPSIDPELMIRMLIVGYCYGIRFERRKLVPIYYKGVKLGVPLRLDLIVEEKVIVDLKAKEEGIRLDGEKLLSYLRLSNLRLGLIINFHSVVLKDGISRVVNGLQLPLPEPGSFSL